MVPTNIYHQFWCLSEEDSIFFKELPTYIIKTSLAHSPFTQAPRNKNIVVFKVGLEEKKHVLK